MSASASSSMAQPEGATVAPTMPASGTSSAPAVLSSKEAEKCLLAFEQTFLSKKTNVKFLYLLKSVPSNPQLRVGEIELTDNNFSQAFLKLAPRTESAVCFITRFVASQGGATGEKRLAISPASFRWFLEHLAIPHSFVAVLSKQLTPSAWSGSIPERPDANGGYTCWYTIPVRVAVDCTGGRTPHALSEAGSNQMNPSNYLHLEDLKSDIRPSILAIYYQRGQGRGGERAVCVNFQDGRWPKFVQEPGQRMKEVLESAAGPDSGATSSCQFTVHLVLFSSAAAWWSQALESFNHQVIEYEQQLIKKAGTAADNRAKFYDDINKALHTMASHLHRYRAELQISEQNLCRLTSCIANMSNLERRTSHGHGEDGSGGNNAILPEDIGASIHVVSSQFEALKILTEELDAKVQAVLSLMFHLTQMSHMQLLVDNGQSLRNVMISTRDEARSSRRMAAESQAMARAMRKDSVSMKTLALVSVLFLPGGTFAAILSMPFFTGEAWLTEPVKVWLWFVLTVPATLVAMAVYVYFVRKGSGIQKEVEVELERSDLAEGGAFDAA